MLNNEKPGLDNVWVRKAINCAIDKEEVIRQALDGMGTVAISQTPFNLPGHSEENADVYYPALAAQYLSLIHIEMCIRDSYLLVNILGFIKNCMSIE